MNPPNHSEAAVQSRDVPFSGATISRPVRPAAVCVTAHAVERAAMRFGLARCEVRREVLDAFSLGLVQRARPRELAPSHTPSRRWYRYARVPDRSRVYVLAIDGAQVSVLTVLHGLRS